MERNSEDEDGDAAVQTATNAELQVIANIIMKFV